MVATGSESPIVVVLSGSMEPAFHRGDLLFLTNKETEDIRVGEIVVFKVNYFFRQVKLCQKYFFFPLGRGPRHTYCSSGYQAS